jgi:hypothetical protein
VPTLPLCDYHLGHDVPVSGPTGGAVNIPLTQFRCLVEVPGYLFPQDAIIDTGAPLIVFPESIWNRFQPGVDFDFLPFAGASSPPARVAGWTFTYQFARFRGPLALLDTGLTTRVPRPDVIAQFATGDPPGWRSSPPILIGVWGGLLEGGRLGIDRDPQTARATGELLYP